MTPKQRIARIQRRLALTAEKYSEFKPLVPPGVLFEPWTYKVDPHSEEPTRESYNKRIARLEELWHAELAWLATYATELQDQAESREEDVASLNGVVDSLGKALDNRRTVEGWVNDSDEERHGQLIRDMRAGTFTVTLTDLGLLDLVDCPDGECESRTQYEFDFQGATPDEAFAKAAEWVRGINND